MNGKRRVKILAVDDEEHFLELLMKTLQKEGYEVRTATGGEEALRRLELERFDLALVDIRMAPIDGLQVLEDIRVRWPHTRVIMITAYPTAENQTVSLQRGAYRYLTKPVEIHELKQTVQRALAHLDNP